MPRGATQNCDDVSCAELPGNGKRCVHSLLRAAVNYQAWPEVRLEAQSVEELWFRKALLHMLCPRIEERSQLLQVGLARREAFREGPPEVRQPLREEEARPPRLPGR